MFALINHPERIIREQKIKLTDQQITAIKGRIAEGFLEIEFNAERNMAQFNGVKQSKGVSVVYGKELPFVRDKTFYSFSDCKLYDFCAQKNSTINLKELLKENGVKV